MLVRLARLAGLEGLRPPAGRAKGGPWPSGQSNWAQNCPSCWRSEASFGRQVSASELYLIRRANKEKEDVDVNVNVARLTNSNLIPSLACRLSHHLCFWASSARKLETFELPLVISGPLDVELPCLVSGNHPGLNWVSGLEGGEPDLSCPGRAKQQKRTPNRATPLGQVAAELE